MGRGDSTLDLGSSIEASRRHEPQWPALMIAWAPFEPERVGEVALFEASAGAKILGRGSGGVGGARAVFQRQLPGLNKRMQPLQSPGLSREQLRIRPDRGMLHIRQLGRCAMVFRGQRVDECKLMPGDAVLLKRQLLLYCTQRPRLLDVAHSASLADAPAFGEPDAHGLVGESPAIWRLRERLAWMGTADEHTLLLGASGSGKELCARAVHALSAVRARGPFVARNAATIPTGLIDAELFGNIKNYPNPGMAARPGLIGSAHGGVLFLDEIGELPEALQANLLRVLDEHGEYHSLGSSKAKRSDFRLIGATNRRPEALKHDLAARLVIRLEVPGLGQRREDIPLLARHLLRRIAAKSPEAVRRFADPARDGELRVAASLVEALLQHHYTTNVRELEALLWRAISQSTGETIVWQEQPPDSAARPPAAREPVAQRPVAQEPIAQEPAPSEEEVRAILQTHDGNVARAARALGLSSRYVLYRLIKKYQID